MKFKIMFVENLNPVTLPAQEYIPADIGDESQGSSTIVVVSMIIEIQGDSTK